MHLTFLKRSHRGPLPSWTLRQKGGAEAVRVSRAKPGLWSQRPRFPEGGPAGRGRSRWGPRGTRLPRSTTSAPSLWEGPSSALRYPIFPAIQRPEDKASWGRIRARLLHHPRGVTAATCQLTGCPEKDGLASALIDPFPGREGDADQGLQKSGRRQDKQHLGRAAEGGREIGRASCRGRV